MVNDRSSKQEQQVYEDPNGHGLNCRNTDNAENQRFASWVKTTPMAASESGWEQNKGTREVRKVGYPRRSERSLPYGPIFLLVERMSGWRRGDGGGWGSKAAEGRVSGGTLWWSSALFGPDTLTCQTSRRGMLESRRRSGFSSLCLFLLCGLTPHPGGSPHMCFKIWLIDCTTPFFFTKETVRSGTSVRKNEFFPFFMFRIDLDLKVSYADLIPG